ncbi:DUF4145 domain-containing protein [Desulfocurvus sp. DL9XJH121]
MGTDVLASYPQEAIPFDTSGIPESVCACFQEALTCRTNNCFIASAIMVRRTLEVICDDVGAQGGNLFQRLDDLKTKVTLPMALLDAAQELRILGNDAAHVEARDYTAIGPDELDVAILFAQEIMKGLYQYQDLLGKLQALKNGSQA